MDYVSLGRSGLVSSVIGLGGGSSGRFGLVKGGSADDAIRLIRGALDQGITFFDGAGISGGVDELLAEALAGSRDDVLISTKIHLGPEPYPLTNARIAHRVSSWIARRSGAVCSRRTVRKRVERTLRALRTDRVDILHLHAVSPRQYPQVARVAAELLKLKEEGKLRAIGISEGFLSDPGHAMLKAAVSDGFFDTVMAGFNPANASAADYVLPRAGEKGIGTIGMFAMRGLIGWQVDGMEDIMAEAGVGSLAELAYRYSRHQPGLDVLLTGTGSPTHLKQNIAAALAPPLPVEVATSLRELQAGGASTRK